MDTTIDNSVSINITPNKHTSNFKKWVGMLKFEYKLFFKSYVFWITCATICIALTWLMMWSSRNQTLQVAFYSISTTLVTFVYLFVGIAIGAKVFCSQYTSSVAVGTYTLPTKRYKLQLAKVIVAISMQLCLMIVVAITFVISGLIYLDASKFGSELIEINGMTGNIYQCLLVFVGVFFVTLACFSALAALFAPKVQVSFAIAAFLCVAMFVVMIIQGFVTDYDMQDIRFALLPFSHFLALDPHQAPFVGDGAIFKSIGVLLAWAVIGSTGAVIVHNRQEIR